MSRFADEIAREEKAQVFAIRIDCSDSRSVREAFEGVLSLGFVEILVYNAYQPLSSYPTSFQDLRIDSFHKSLAVSSVGAFHCAQQVPTFLSIPPSINLHSLCFSFTAFIHELYIRCCPAWLKEEREPFSSRVVPLLSTALLDTPNYVNTNYISFFSFCILLLLLE